MDQAIVFENENGLASVNVMYVSKEVSIESLIETKIDKSKRYRVVNVSELPHADTNFFDAWKFGEDLSIVIDMEKARDIHRVNLRRLRIPLFQELDVQYMRALEMNDVQEMQRVVIQKQNLRDITKHPAISNAHSTSELKALTLDALLQ